jgi:hypothetical protein
MTDGEVLEARPEPASAHYVSEARLRLVRAKKEERTQNFLEAGPFLSSTYV